MRIFVNDDHQGHDVQGELHNGTLVRSFECPERLQIIRDSLSAQGFAFEPPSHQADIDLLARVHSRDYLDFLQTAWSRWQAEHPGTNDALGFCWPAHGLRKRALPPSHIDAAMGYYSFCVDTGVNAGTWAAAKAGADCAYSAAMALEASRQSFALTRPPGHHAHTDMYGGYCFLNNAAVAAQALLEQGAKRVAILDVDYHHGNGTQAIFYDRADVLTISLHADPDVEFPYFLGFTDEVGEGAGEGFNLNLPMPFGTDFTSWSQALEIALARVADYSPDALVVPLGVDSYFDDPISNFVLQSQDFVAMGQRLAAVGLPTLVTMEGGYATGALGQNVVNFIQGLTGR